MPHPLPACENDGLQDIGVEKGGGGMRSAFFRIFFRIFWAGPLV